MQKVLPILNFNLYSSITDYTIRRLIPIWFEKLISTLKYIPFPFPVGVLSQYIQIDWCGLHQSKQHPLNISNVKALLWFPLPTAQHHIIDILGTEPWRLQYPALSDALYHLGRQRDTWIYIHHILSANIGRYI